MARLGDMPPRFACDHLMYCRAHDAQRSGHLAKGSLTLAGSDPAHFGGREFGEAVPHTTWFAAVAHGVLAVRLFGIPTKVVEAVVGAVVILVAGFHTWWARSYECQEDEAVDAKPSTVPARLSQQHFEPFPLVNGLENSWDCTRAVVGRKAANTAEVGYLVPALVSWNWFPRFVHAARLQGG